MSVWVYHHKELVSFLKEVKDTTPELSFITPVSEEWNLFNLIIKSGDKLIKHARAAELVDKSASQLSKTTQPQLNNMLRAFSERCKIKPPIRLYFNTVGDYPGGHFACCDIGDNVSKSEHFVRLEDLQIMLENARQMLGLGSVIVKNNTPNEQQIDPIETNVDINSEANQLESKSSNNFNHERSQNMENEAIKRLYMKLTNEIEEISKAMVHSYDEESANMFFEMWELKKKQLLELEFKMNKFDTDDLSPKERKKFRKELGLSEEPDQ